MSSYYITYIHVHVGFPNVLGCVDGTFVRIIAPSENEPDFLNRKGFNSLNVQVSVKY